MHRPYLRLAAVLCVAAVVAACSSEGGNKGSSEETPSGPAPAWSAPARQDQGGVNRRDFNGDGKDDALVNGWYKHPKTGGKWYNNRFVALASPSGLDPAKAVRLAHRWAKPDPRLTSAPAYQDRSAQFTGDLDDDGHADVVVDNVLSSPDGKYTSNRRIVWGGSKDAAGATVLSRSIAKPIGTGDVDGDGALDLLTLDEAVSDSGHQGKRQYATVLHGPFNRSHATPRTTTRIDVSHEGWVPVVHTAIGDFDGDGRDDLVTKAQYDEEDARFEDDDMPEVDGSSYYRGTEKGLSEAAPVPGIRAEDTSSGGEPLVAADFNGDKRVDLLTGNTGGTHVVYGSKQGPGQGRSTTDLHRLHLSRAVTGDINGDGYADLATESLGEDRRIGRVSVRLGTPDGLTTETPTRIDRYSIGLGGKPTHSGDRDEFGWDLVLCDLDADGRDELLIGTFGFNTPRKEAGYWVLAGTKDGPSVTDRRFVKTMDFGS
ncbi:FG-GAP repeat domain-containing protein [Streptomyces sp. NBC_01314]|uniref:FG-GAP repeat domain-containing protein n=1 Tax=Streptomyces sp. NBC_01314 TaxID=2903821 RepID=UPI00309259AF|nr:VCBS repeat-containing protein [Streptomyces sp. NBC_01314]